MPRPVFISLLYRSGSTLLTLALDQSQELKMSYDTIHFMRFSYGRYLPIEKNYRQLLKDTKSRIESRWNLKLNDDEIAQNIAKHKTISEAIIYDEIMRSFLSLEQGQRWGDRTAVKWDGIVPFLNMFSDGKAIHIFRDPRAVLASFREYTYHPGLMYMDAIFASLAMFNFIEQESIAKNERIYLLKYEDLVAFPERILREICDFLEIEFNWKMLDVGSFKDRFGELFDGNSSFKSRRDRIDRTTVNLWQEKLSSIELYFTEMVLRGKLRDHGYELSGIDLTKQDIGEMYKMLHSDYLSKRYKYWLKNADGKAAYPDTEEAYSEDII